MTYPTLIKTEWVEGPKDGDRSSWERPNPAFFDSALWSDEVHMYAWAPSRNAMIYLGLVPRHAATTRVQPLLVGVDR